MDSTLILEYAQSLAAAGRSLMPSSVAEKERSCRKAARALAYPRHWAASGCLSGARAGAHASDSGDADRINQAGVTTAVAWYFTRAMLPEIVPATQFPTLEGFSKAAEQLAEFRAAPHGAGTYLCPS